MKDITWLFSPNPTFNNWFSSIGRWWCIILIFPLFVILIFFLWSSLAFSAFIYRILETTNATMKIFFLTQLLSRLRVSVKVFKSLFCVLIFPLMSALRGEVRRGRRRNLTATGASLPLSLDNSINLLLKNLYCIVNHVLKINVYFTNYH